MEGFEGLKFVPPVLPPHHYYWYIRLETLSSEQLEFLATHFKTDSRYVPESPTQDVVISDNMSEELWTNRTQLMLKSCTLVSFNDLFKEV